MIVLALRQMTLVAAAWATLAAVSPRHAGAADTSSWNGDARSAMRLLAGQTAGPPGELRAGIELRLAAGWKTYWRYPGDSGVPPVFDFSKSENLKSVEVRWPAPHRFTDDSGASIGYKGSVVLPLHLVAQNASRPVVLRIAMDYAICERLCIPAKGAANLDISRATTANNAALAAAEALVPQPVPLGDPGPLAVRAMRQEGGAKPRVIVEVAAPAGVGGDGPGAPLDLFVEGPTSDWALPVPEPIDSGPGAVAQAAGPGGLGGQGVLHRFAFEIDGVPPGASATGARLRFTLVAGDRSIEATGTLE